MHGIDLRAFRDPLASERERREWQRDSALARVQVLRAELADACRHEARCAQEVEAQAALLAQSWRTRADPNVHTRALAFLAEARHRAAEANRKVVECTARLRSAQSRLADCERRAQAVREVRDEALRSFRVEQERKAAARADDAWTMARPSRRCA